MFEIVLRNQSMGKHKDIGCKNFFFKNTFFGSMSEATQCIGVPPMVCGSKDPACETFCTNKGPNIFFF